ncbi:MAG: hypothetical protein ACI8TP_005292 [Acidimicrobiales bacterium]|jgi:hypothetical protein
MNAVPAGWHPDPSTPGQERYWDGMQWSHDVRPIASPADMPPPAQMLPSASASPIAPATPVSTDVGLLRTLGLVAIGGFALAALGSLLPWATLNTGFGSISISGTSGDGVITLLSSFFLAGLTVIALVLGPVRKKWLLGTAAGTGLLTLLAMWELGNVSSNLGDVSNEFAQASTGVGLWVLLLGSLVAVTSLAVAIAKS